MVYRGNSQRTWKKWFLVESSVCAVTCSFEEAIRIYPCSLCYHGPGQQLSRAFLETYAEERVLELCHDEARLPAYADAFGFKLVDNGFCRKWFNKAEWKYFNCEQKEIADGIIHQELKKKNGKRVFHPVRRVVGLADLKAT